MENAIYEFVSQNVEYASLINDKQKLIYQNRMMAGDWLEIFLWRVKQNEYDAPISLKDFLDKKEFIKPLEAYGINAIKFWVALNFIYDLTIDRTECVRQDKKTIDVFKDVYEYINKHPNFSIYLSEGEGVSAKKSHKITNLRFRYELTKMVRAYITQYSTRPDKIDIMTRYWENDDPGLRATFEKDLGKTFSIYYMYSHINYLLSSIITKTKRTTRDSLISFNRRLLISRIIYTYGLTNNSEYRDSCDGLNGIIQQCRHKESKFQVLSKIYKLL